MGPYGDSSDCQYSSESHSAKGTGLGNGQNAGQDIIKMKERHPDDYEMLMKLRKTVRNSRLF